MIKTRHFMTPASKLRAINLMIVIHFSFSIISQCIISIYQGFPSPTDALRSQIDANYFLDNDSDPTLMTLGRLVKNDICPGPEGCTRCCKKLYHQGFVINAIRSARLKAGHTKYQLSHYRYNDDIAQEVAKMVIEDEVEADTGRRILTIDLAFQCFDTRDLELLKEIGIAPYGEVSSSKTLVIKCEIGTLPHQVYESSKRRGAVTGQTLNAYCRPPDHPARTLILPATTRCIESTEATTSSTQNLRIQTWTSRGGVLPEATMAEHVDPRSEIPEAKRLKVSLILRRAPMTQSEQDRIIEATGLRVLPASLDSPLTAFGTASATTSTVQVDRPTSGSRVRACFHNDDEEELDLSLSLWSKRVDSDDD